MNYTIFDAKEQSIYIEDINDIKNKFDYIDRHNIVPSFRRTRDPIALAFEHIDSCPLNKLAQEFVKDALIGTICFISKAFK